MKYLIWIIIFVYVMGMMWARRYTCGCDDHAGSDLLMMIFWPIAVPIYYIRRFFGGTA